jgi:hypothetical protein
MLTGKLYSLDHIHSVRAHGITAANGVDTSFVKDKSTGLLICLVISELVFISIRIN